MRIILFTSGVTDSSISTEYIDIARVSSILYIFSSLALVASFSPKNALKSPVLTSLLRNVELTKRDIRFCNSLLDNFFGHFCSRVAWSKLSINQLQAKRIRPPNFS